MSVTSGFFDSIEGDRVYNAEQMSSIFDGVIKDGVYAGIGNCFRIAINDASAFSISVGTGRAWLNKTWILNDSALVLTLDEPELVLTRIDAVVLKADRSTNVREGSIEIIKGTPSASGTRPALPNTSEIKCLPLAYITLPPNASSLTTNNITSVIGLDACPYVISPVKSVSVSELYSSWNNEWNDWMDDESTNWANWMSQQRTNWTSWMSSEQTDFDAWFAGLQDTLDGDVASNLAQRISNVEGDVDNVESSLVTRIGNLENLLNSRISSGISIECYDLTNERPNVTTTFTNIALLAAVTSADDTRFEYRGLYLAAKGHLYNILHSGIPAPVEVKVTGNNLYIGNNAGAVSIYRISCIIIKH